ncbi:hypothetical protein AXK57_21900 [Tsukamurella pulmonis]|uniref:hypothetical protein n=1 Tax=Tsukamurella pulmonis TaxID=47312 RepID=UPI000795E8F7|nr:hypothetical protein [Tsukamurella pulmonis]KXP11597.1 hypothetical protein AXK57_21900 [Tsukamurella pulmonis]
MTSTSTVGEGRHTKRTSASPRWWQRAVQLAVAIAMLLGLSAAVGVGTAAADPAPQPGAGTALKAGELPQGFPDDLKKYVAGTPEFQGASWFTGECKEKGGDVGAYINESMRVEGKLMYWSQNEEGRKNNGADTKEIPSFPAGDSAFFLPTGMCAKDMEAFGTKSWTVWNFEFAQKPDEGSKTAMFDAANKIIKERGGFGTGGLEPGMKTKVPDEEWDASTASPQYRIHAFFLNCEQAGEAGANSKCRGWNTAVGKLLGGTWAHNSRNDSFGDRLKKAWDGTVNPFINAWNSIYSSVKGVVDFVKDPSSVIGQWANALKSSAMDMIPKTLKGLATVGEFDYNSPWFLEWYAIAVALGWLSATIMLLITFVQGSREKIPMSDVVASILQYTPATLILMSFLPALMSFVLKVSNDLTRFLAGKIGMSTDEVVNNVSKMFGDLTDQTLVGGTIMGIIGFGLLLIGAVALYIGFLMKLIAIPLATVGAAIGLGMLVNPNFRAKALRPILAILALILSTPLLFVLLGVVFGALNAAAKGASTGEGEIKSLGMLAFCALCFMIVGLAPFALLKWAPVLPSEDDAPGFQSGGGTAIGAAAGAAGSNFVRQQSQRPVVSGGSGGGSGGAGGAGGQPAGTPGSSKSSGDSMPGKQVASSGKSTSINSSSSGAGKSGVGSSGRVGGHGAQFVSAGKGGGAGKAIGAGMSAAAAAAAIGGVAAVSAAGSKVRQDFESSAPKGSDPNGGR